MKNDSVTPIADKRAEASYLSCAIVDPANAETILAAVDAADFLFDLHRRVFNALCKLVATGRPAGDSTLLLDELRQQGGEPIRPADVADLFKASPSSISWPHYAEVVRETARKRRIELLGEQLLGAARNGEAAGEIIAGAQRSLERIVADNLADDFRPMTTLQLLEHQSEISYLIRGILAANQPAILGGPQKSLKTSFALGMALALATGEPFLGRFTVERRSRVLVMSGESGLPVIRETLRRIADAMQIDLQGCDGLLVCDKLPQLANALDLAKLKRMLRSNQTEVLIVDPVYLCMSGADAGNLFAQGAILRGVSELCQSLGVTLVLVHHTRKGNIADPNAAPELEHLAWSGFAEFARQWILVSRREKYLPGTGLHRLWLTGGGSAGHSFTWAVDVNEGEYDPDRERIWDTAISTPDESRQDRDAWKEQTRAEKQRKRLDECKRRIVDAMRKTPEGDTKTAIRDRAGLDAKESQLAFGELLMDGVIDAAEIRKCNKAYEGYRLVAE